MEQLSVTLKPNNTGNPTIVRNTSDPQLVIDGLAHDTYTVTVISDAYETYTGTLLVNADVSLNIALENLRVDIITWITQSLVTNIPITTVYTNDPSLPIGQESVTNEGIVGKTTKTWEAEYINGSASGVTRDMNTVITVPMVPRQVKRGTGEPTSILTQENITATYATNIYQNNVRIPGDVVPLNTPFEIRQLDEPSGSISIYDGMLEPNKPYTLALTMENKGTAIDMARFIIGLSFFGGEHFVNGVKVSIPPNAGEYNLKPYFPNTGIVKYHYQFYTEMDTPNGDYMQPGFSNATKNTIMLVSKVGVYNGHINPFV